MLQHIKSCENFATRKLDFVISERVVPMKKTQSLHRQRSHWLWEVTEGLRVNSGSGESPSFGTGTSRTKMKRDRRRCRAGCLPGAPWAVRLRCLIYDPGLRQIDISASLCGSFTTGLFTFCVYFLRFVTFIKQQSISSATHTYLSILWYWCRETHIRIIKLFPNGKAQITSHHFHFWCRLQLTPSQYQPCKIIVYLSSIHLFPLIN